MYPDPIRPTNNGQILVYLIVQVDFVSIVKLFSGNIYVIQDE